jgi:acetyl esterase
MTSDEARAAVRGMTGLMGAAHPRVTTSEIAVPTRAGSVRALVHRPEAVRDPAVLVFVHGGGWTIGDPDLVAVPAGQLAGRAGVIVVNVDHRHAPEHPFPAPLDDVEDATRWVIDHARELGGDGRVAVGGESSGGNLAAAVSVRLRDDPSGAELAHQLLVYPVLDRDFTTASYRENGSGYLLTRDAMRLFWSRYLGPDAAPDPEGTPSPSPVLASPLRLADLAGLPPATVLTAEYDPLRDEGERYAARLAAAGVPTRLTRHPGVTHATWYFEGVLSVAARFAEDAAAGLRAGLEVGVRP